MTEANFESTVRAYFAATRTMDEDAWVSTFAEGAVCHDPAEAPPIQGHDALREFFRGVTQGFDKEGWAGLVTEHAFFTESSAAVKWTGRGTGKNGRDVRFEGIDIFEFDGNGKIAKFWGYWNPAGMITELRKPAGGAGS